MDQGGLSMEIASLKEWKKMKKLEKMEVEEGRKKSREGTGV